MRPEKLYTLRQSGRRSRQQAIIVRSAPPTIVVSVPPALSTTPSPEPARTLQSRLWSVAKVAGPAFIAVVALVISLMTYVDQHATYQASQEATVTADARLVTAWFTADARTLEIENRSADPVYNVEIVVTGTSPNETETGVALYLGEFPPCSAYLETMQDITKYVRGYIRLPVSTNNITEVAFADSNNTTWYRTMTGSILEENSNFVVISRKSISQVLQSFSPAADCPLYVNPN